MKENKVKKVNILFIILTGLFLSTTILLLYGLWLNGLNYNPKDELINQVAYRYNEGMDSYDVVGFGKIESQNPNHLTKEEANVVLVDEINGKPVKKIANNAFAHTHINSIVLSKNIEVIGEFAFYQAPLVNIVWNDKITHIYNYAFSQTKLEELVIPSSVTVIGGNAFEQASSLSKITFNSNDLLIAPYAFFNCYNLDSVTFNGNVTLGSYSFALTRLFEIKFKKQAVINQHAFYNAGSLNMLSFGGKTEIHDYAFVETKIKYIDLTNVIDIGEYSFSPTYVMSVYFPNSNLSFKETSFSTIEIIYYEGDVWEKNTFNSYSVMLKVSHEEFILLNI